MVKYFAGNTVEVIQSCIKFNCDELDVFNDFLSDLYDWADYNRVWCG